MCAITPPARLALPTDRHAPRHARAFLRQASCRCHAKGGADAAELLVSELVTNAVCHGEPPVSVQVDCREERGLRVGVSDASHTEPVTRAVGSGDEGGRGLAIVQELSDSWGVEHDEHGKLIWFCVGGGPARRT